MTLSHETYNWSVTALEEGTVTYIRSKGINLITVAECIDQDPYEVVTGVYGIPDDSWTCDGPYVPMQSPTTNITNVTNSTPTQPPTSQTSSSSSTSPSPTCVSTYTAEQGDTCDTIGSKYGLSGATILAANTFLNCADICEYFIHVTLSVSQDTTLVRKRVSFWALLRSLECSGP
jgi:hypothetical protein